MSKPFDSVMKDLLDNFSIDWVSWLAPVFELPPTLQVQPCDVDLSTVQITADKVFELCPPYSGFLHIEPQSSRDADLPVRLACYNLLIESKNYEPVYTVAVLLRREAQFPDLTGILRRQYGNQQQYLEFHYGIVRVWELDGNALLSGPIGATPLTLLTDTVAENLKHYVDALEQRYIEEQIPDAVQSFLLTSGFILSGLRYTKAEIRAAFKGVSAMKESVAYEAILEEGEERGEIRGEIRGVKLGEIKSRQEDILAVLEGRFGFLTAELVDAILAITESQRLKALVLQAATIDSLDQLVL